jgi:hypothetical protein
MGTTTWQTNSIPYFNGTNFTERNSALSFNGTTLTASYASTTAFTVSGTAYLAAVGGTAFSSLSANYLPKWNSGTWANSELYDTGSAVGIGTTSPWGFFAINPSGIGSEPEFVRWTPIMRQPEPSAKV